jgi:hypothetical protein
MFRRFFPGSKRQFGVLRLHRWKWTIVPAPVLLALISLNSLLRAAPIEAGTVQALVSQRNVDELKKLGRDVLP